MCLASEAGKMDIAQSQPEHSSSTESLQQTTVKPEIKEEKADESSQSSALLPLPSSVTSTSFDAISPQLSSQNTRVKNKIKKKEVANSNDEDEGPPIIKKTVKLCIDAESNMDRVLNTIEAVAKGACTDPEERTKRKIPISPSGGPKKRSKPKVKTFVKEREEELGDDGGQCEQSIFSEVEMKEITDVSPNAQGEEENIGSTDIQDNLTEPCNAPSSPSLSKLKEEDKGKERPSDGSSESNPENRGSRKSERSCKGALYKTLVSEGMLTSLRANIDRGKRGTFRSSDHDASWSDDSWTVSQMGPNNPKKLKKSKSKDEPSQGLGKLEEEFERKFNSLPQYSPMTFDKKGSAVPKKKKPDSPVQEDISKARRGPSSSQKKTSFHKIVRKHKHRKEKPVDKVVQSDSSMVDSATQVKSCAPGSTVCPDIQGTTSMEMLVGSQKRKARKTKITHLVRTADGSVSPVEEDKTRDLTQEQDKKPLPQQNLCNDKGCYSNPRAEELERSTVPQELPAFFSLAALAEVAAMENVHRCSNLQVKVWNLDKRDSGNPLCTRIFPAIPGNKPTEVSCLSVHENLNFMAIGFTDGSVILTKGDITRDRHSKTLTLHEGTSPVTGLAFRQVAKITHLFVATLEKVYCYTMSVKEYPKIELDTHGCALHCSSLADPSQDSQFIVAGDECVYLYQPDERGPCFAFDGHKLLVHWHRGYLFLLVKDTKSPNKTEFGSRDSTSSDKQRLTIYDLDNKFIAYSASFDDVIDVVAEWGSFYILTRDGKMFALQEKDTQTKLEMLFKKNLFVMAINLAKSQHLDSDGLSEIFRQYGDHLYLKGDHDGAIQQYIRTIGKLEPSYVIRKFLDAQRIHNLTAYLQALHRQSLANADHTTLLLNCYTKLKDSSKLEEFIKSSESEVHFDVEIAIKVLRQASYHSHAVFLAEKHMHHEWYLKIQLEDLKNYQEGLRYIGRLPFEQAESNMKRYGKTLMHHVPEGTTLLLKGLCTNYQPSGDLAEKDSLDKGHIRKANSEEFIPVFANNPRELKAFLEHMIDVDHRSPQGVYDTLLELRLQDWAHVQDPERKKVLQDEAVSLLRSDNTVFDKALVLCQMHNFKEGILYLYEKGKLYQQIMHYHMQNEEYGKVIEACKRYGDHEGCLWEQALGYFARKEEDCKAYISEVLHHIDQNNLMPPLLVVQTLAHNSTATLSVIKDYLINKLQRESQQIEDDERKIHQYREETTHLRSEIQELKTSAKIFQKTKCNMCNSPLELPSVHFLCSHSFHQHCFESYAESEVECPTCTPENRKVMDMLRAQDQKRDLHDHFNRQLRTSNDGFSVVADYFGRGVFNKLTLVTDPPGSKTIGSLEVNLQRDLLVHAKRNC
ncbi:uncharacterized protein V6R79_000323 [Siganus canaliculatus]